jgi:predicted DNA-binding transcriptional regulator YafY
MVETLSKHTVMKNINELPQTTYERLEYLEFMLRFRGWVSRADLKDRFGISDAGATRDIRLYRDISNGGEKKPDINTSLNNTTKKYELLENTFEPVFSLTIQQAFAKIRKEEFSEALNLTGSDGILTPPRIGLPDINILSCITRAISGGHALDVKYWAVKNGFSEKSLIPHAIFDNGVHWYLRAYDRKKSEFRAYALTRFVDVKIDSNILPDTNRRMEDHQWNRMVKLELVAHPNKNNVKQPKAIEHDFRMKDGKLEVSCRAVVAGYWLALWNVDCTEDHSLEGYQYQLWLQNHNTLYDVESREIAPGLAKYKKNEDK